MRNAPIMKPIIFIVIAAFCTTIIPFPALHAAMLPTASVFENDSDNIRCQVKRIMETQAVQQALEKRGVSTVEAMARVDALSDAQLQRLAAEMESLPSGQGLGTLVGAAVFVFVLLLILDIAGVTDVFPFVVKNR